MRRLGCVFMLFAVGVACGPPPPGPSVLTGAVQVAAGAGHSCVIITGGAIRCWGANPYGQLGNGTTTDSPVAVPVATITNAVQVAAGALHTCAVLSGGTVSCWGWNANGQLGYSGAGSTTPVPVAGVTGAVGVVAGLGHTCALLSGGTVTCWGDNNYGQLGDGTTASSASPVSVINVDDVTQLATGSLSSHSCALLAGGAIQCWGANQAGQLGNGTISSSPPFGVPAPVVVSGINDATQIASGTSHACARRAGGTVSCWGDNNYRQLSGTSDGSSVPVPVAGVNDAAQVIAGDYHSCVRRSGGTVSCWGSNFRGQLGDGSVDTSTAPVPVSGLTGVTQLSGSLRHNCAVVAAGAVKCWGTNYFGELGNGSATRSLPFAIPTPVDVLSG